MTKLNVRSGDLIEWVYERDDELVAKHEKLWSTIEYKWVPIGREFIHLCVSYDGETISWLNEKGLFFANIIDIVRSHQYPELESVKLRVRN